jgi:prevent-host-death family protein
MRTATIHEAKTHLSKLLRETALGQEVVILHGSKPVAKLIPYSTGRARQPGSLKGTYTTPDAFFDPLPEEELSAWES